MLKKIFPQSEFFFHVATLVTGTTLAQAIPVLISPLLSRIYSPADFAVFGIIMGVVNIASVIVCGRYELAVVLPKSDKDALNLIVICGVIAFFFSGLFCLIIFFFKSYIVEMFNNSHVEPLLYYIPVFLFIIGFYQPVNFWLIRKKEFKKNAINKIAQTTGIALIALLLGYMNASTGLILGYLGGWIIMLFMGYYQARTSGLIISEVNSFTARKNLKQYKEFPLYNLFPALLNAVSSLLPLFFISKYFNETFTGYFNFSRQIIATPLILISSALAQVYFQKIVSLKNNNQPIMANFKKVVKHLSLFSGILIVIFYFFGRWLFVFVFGAKWEDAGTYSSILIFSYAVQFVVTPLANLLPALGKIKLASIWPLVYFVLLMSLFFFRNEPIQTVITILVVIDVISYAFYYYIIFHSLVSYEKTRINHNQVLFSPDKPKAEL